MVRFYFPNEALGNSEEWKKLQELAAKTSEIEQYTSRVRTALEHASKTDQSVKWALQTYPDGLNNTVREINSLAKEHGIDIPALNILKENPTMRDTMDFVEQLATHNATIDNHCDNLAKQAIEKSREVVKSQSANVAAEVTNSIQPTKGFFGKFKEHLAEGGKGANRTTGSTIAGVAIGTGGTALAIDGIRRIHDKEENTVVGIVETGTGLGLVAEGGLRATTGNGVGFWAQKVTQAAKAAHNAHVIG